MCSKLHGLVRQSSSRLFGLPRRLTTLRCADTTVRTLRDPSPSNGAEASCPMSTSFEVLELPEVERALPNSALERPANGSNLKAVVCLTTRVSMTSEPVSVGTVNTTVTQGQAPSELSAPYNRNDSCQPGSRIKPCALAIKMSTVSIQNPAAAATSQNVTLPSIPELFDPNFLDVLIPPQAAPEPKASEGEAAPVPSNAMMDALRSTAHQKLTTNAAPTFSSTLVATLDAFLGLRTRCKGEMIERYLRNSWEEDPELTLRIIWCTRSIHDGKGEKELFYRAFGWLFETHPRTAICNLHLLVEPVCLRPNKKTGKKTRGAAHGSWKDLLDILAMATLDELRPKRPLDPRSNFLHNYYDGKSRPAFKNNEEQEQWSREQRVKRFEDAHERLSRKLLDDRRFRALYIAVARLFAGQLAKDFDTMDKISTLPRDATKKARMSLMHALSLASKWAPTPGAAHDRVTNIASAICLLLHEAQVSSSISHRLSSYHSPTPLDMHLLRSFYQRHVLTRGRRLSCVPEPLMSSNRWSEILYTRVASVSMSKNKEKFFLHDEERFLDYLKDVESGNKQISGATLLPHVLVQEAHQLHFDTDFTRKTTRRLADALLERKARLAEANIQVVNAQWATLVTRLRESGQLDNSIAVCDVSGSMGFLSHLRATSKNPFDVLPIFPAISLSLLVARLAKPPFKDAFITFSATPELVTLDPESARVSLGATVTSMNQASWGMNTDFNAIFLKLILPLAIKHNVPKDQMIKRIFVFSDMQFDEARGARSDEAQNAAEWNTNHDVIVKAYQEAGYDVPEMVYWDLSNPEDGLGVTAPVTGDREGVALLSGYSASLLKVFMDVEEEDEWEVLDKEGRPEKQALTPVEFMKKALGRKSFEGLRVID